MKIDNFCGMCGKQNMIVENLPTPTEYDAPFLLRCLSCKKESKTWCKHTKTPEHLKAVRTRIKNNYFFQTIHIKKESQIPLDSDYFQVMFASGFDLI